MDPIAQHLMEYGYQPTQNQPGWLSFPLRGGHDHIELQLATDDLCVHGFTLHNAVPGKGEVVTALKAYWLTCTKLKFYRHDLVACGKEVAQFLPRRMHNLNGIFSRLMVVEKTTGDDRQYKVHGYLVEEAYASYLKTHEVGGFELTPGLRQGSQLNPEIVETICYPPKTKKPRRDAHLRNFALEHFARTIYKFGRDFAQKRGFTVANAGFHFGHSTNGWDQRPMISGDIFTPDCARIWYSHDLYNTFQYGYAAPPSCCSKIEEMCKGNAENVSIPHTLAQQELSNLRDFFYRLTEMGVEDFQRDVLGLPR